MKMTSTETLLTAKIALKADKMRYEHMLKGGSLAPEVKQQYEDCIDRIDRALSEIENGL